MERVVRPYKTRPIVQLQTGIADCGAVCISAILAIFGIDQSTACIKELTGNSTRGLTLRQLRNVLVQYGAEANAIKFDISKRQYYPIPGIVLLKRAHFVVISNQNRFGVEVFDPEFGWVRRSHKSFREDLTGLGIEVRSISPSVNLPSVERGNYQPHRILFSYWKRFLKERTTWAALFIGAVGQLVILTLPILSMKSTNEVSSHQNLDNFSAIAIGFLFISLAGSTAQFLSSFVSRYVYKIASKGVARDLFDSLLSRPSSWFDDISPDVIRNSAASAESILRFTSQSIQQFSTLAITIVVGIISFFYFSPWLALPGLALLLINIAIDSLFAMSATSAAAQAVHTLQRRQAFIGDVLGQLSVFKRSRATNAAKRRFLSLSRDVSNQDFALFSIHTTKDGIRNSLKSLDTLAFVSIAAIFMGRLHYTLGAFVAVGIYKDLIAQALSLILQSAGTYRSMRIHFQQAAEIVGQKSSFRAAKSSPIRGNIELRGVTFKYGKFESKVLDNVNLKVDPGQFVVVSGPSGSGKSTIAKIICGSLEPTSGNVYVANRKPESQMQGFSAVLQTDRLIGGSIRDNITMFKHNISEELLYKLLGIVEMDYFVQNLPMRLSSIVGEGISGLSAGQRQRLLIARAMASTPNCLILDEATSSLDLELEQRIVERLRERCQTLIVISHRPTMWSLSSKHYALEAGRLIQQDNTKSPQRSKFHELCNDQMVYNMRIEQ